jgi:transcriptional regulator with XRE-family HTH domain
VADARAVISAAHEVGRLHRDLRHARDQSEREIQGQLSGWVDKHEDLLVDDSGEYLDDDLIDAAKAFLLTGDPGEEPLDASLLTALEAGRAAIASDLQAALALEEAAAAAVVGPYDAFVSAVRHWLNEARAEGDIGDWARILDTWRTALSLTTREAAAALEVSPSAIVRYSGGSRTPSVPQVVAMVEAMIRWNPAAEDTKIRAAARSITRMFGTDPDRATEILESAGRSRTDLEASIQDNLEALSTTQLSVVAALVSSPTLLNGLATLACDEVFNEIRMTVNAVHGVTPKASL